MFSPISVPSFSFIITVSILSYLSLQQLIAIMLPRQLKLALQTGPPKRCVSFSQSLLPFSLQMLTEPSYEQLITNRQESKKQLGRHCTSLTAFSCVFKRYNSVNFPPSHLHSFTQLSEEPVMSNGGSSKPTIFLTCEKLLVIHLFFSYARILWSQATQLTASQCASTSATYSSCSLSIMTDPSDSPTASTTSLSTGQNAMDSGIQSTFLHIISVIDDLLQVKRSISLEIDTVAKYPKMGRLHATFKIAAFLRSLPRLRSLEYTGSRFCSSLSAEQKKISPLELQAASKLPWQLYCWSRMTPSLRQVQWKRGRMLGAYSVIIQLQINHALPKDSQKNRQQLKPQSMKIYSPALMSLFAFMNTFCLDYTLSLAL